MHDPKMHKITKIHKKQRSRTAAINFQSFRISFSSFSLRTKSPITFTFGMIRPRYGMPAYILVFFVNFL